MTNLEILQREPENLARWVVNLEGSKLCELCPHAGTDCAGVGESCESIVFRWLLSESSA